MNPEVGFMRTLRNKAPHSLIAQMKTQGEAAQYLGLARNTLSVYRRKGKGPKGFAHPSGIVLYPMAELDKWKAGMA